jgi:hypothetical protein
MDRFEWERLIRELDLPASVKCAAYAMATYVNAGDGTRGHPGLGGLSRATGLHRSTVTAALAALEAGGLIARQSHGGGGRGSRGVAAVYRLAAPEDAGTCAETSHAVRRVFGELRRGQRSHCATSDESSEVAPAASEFALCASEVAPCDPITPISPLPTSSLNSGPVVNGPLEGSQGALGQDQHSSGDGGKGTCSVCGQQAELMRTMTGPVIRNHSRGRDGEPFCPGTGEPPADAEAAP